MTISNWIAIIGIIVTIIISRIDARDSSEKAKTSIDLTKQSINEEHRYNNSIVKNNNKMLKQRRSEEAMVAINRFNIKIWPKFSKLLNIMKSRTLNKTEARSLSNIIGIYESWSMYLKTNVADSHIIKSGLENKPKMVKTVYVIMHLGK